MLQDTLELKLKNNMKKKRRDKEGVRCPGKIPSSVCVKRTRQICYDLTYYQARSPFAIADCYKSRVGS